MNMARMTLLVAGAALILSALGVLYYQTDLRNDVPEGAAIAALLGVTGLFALGFSTEFARQRVHTIENVEHRNIEHRERSERPPRPARMGREGSVEEAESREHIEVVRRD